MKILVFSSVLTIFLSLIIFTAGQSRKNGLTLAERVQQLTEMSNKKAVIRFNGNKFRDYVKGVPRNYSVVIMFTAMAPSRQCQICQHANEEFTIVANSFRYSQTYSNKLFFGVVDFDEGSDVFLMLKLNTAPVFIHFPPKGKPKAHDTMDIQRYGFAADAIAKWIHERTDIQIRVFRPPNYTGTVGLFVVFAMVGSFFYVRRNNLEFLYSKRLWGYAALSFCFTMVSGQMWNHIRGPPMVHRTQSGGIAYIHGSAQGQFVLETYIIVVLNILGIKLPRCFYEYEEAVCHIPLAAYFYLILVLISPPEARLRIFASPITPNTDSYRKLSTSNDTFYDRFECTNITKLISTFYERKPDAAIVIGMILMTEAAQPKGNIRKRRIYAVVGLILVSVFFSLILSIFRSKAQGYPYSNSSRDEE